MKTPIADFCRQYTQSNTSRLHMPGHKGSGPLGVEAIDLTEIKGADSLYEADGIIAESEANAAELFGTRKTFYSAGGSSQSIKAMCLLAIRHYQKEHSQNGVILAGRNAHKAFLQASQLIRFGVCWLPSEEESFSLCRCTITPKGLEEQLLLLREEQVPLAAVFVTSPDYLGNVLDIAGLSEVAHAFGVPLLVDNAHGAYRKFLSEDCHPMTLGADACADSAHKTLPVITGGSYLHISKNAPACFEETAREAMCLFGSTSPSYLILQSLDLANDWLENEALSAFSKTIEQVSAVKALLEHEGLTLLGEEPLKVTIDCASSGIGSGQEFADRLRDFEIECEYADTDVVVLMFAPNNTGEDYEKLSIAIHMLMQVERMRQMTGDLRKASEKPFLSTLLPTVSYQPYELLTMPVETVPVEKSLGRIAADLSMGCPPAILPVVPGEKIDSEIIDILRYYGKTEITVL